MGGPEQIHHQPRRKTQLRPGPDDGLLLGHMSFWLPNFTLCQH